MLKMWPQESGESAVQAAGPSPDVYSSNTCLEVSAFDYVLYRDVQSLHKLFIEQ